MDISKDSLRIGSNEGRVLGGLLSREEIIGVSGGSDPCDPKTDSWVDCGTCTLKSDPGEVAAQFL